MDIVDLIPIVVVGFGISVSYGYLFLEFIRARKA